LCCAGFAFRLPAALHRVGAHGPLMDWPVRREFVLLGISSMARVLLFTPRTGCWLLSSFDPCSGGVTAVEGFLGCAGEC